MDHGERFRQADPAAGIGAALVHGITRSRMALTGYPRLEAHNLPEQLKYGIYVGEVAAPILIILGLLTRLVG